MRSVLTFGAVASAWALVAAVRPGDFKKCEDTSLCRRFRRIAEHAETTGVVSPYSVPSGGEMDGHQLRLDVSSALHPDIRFDMVFSFFEDGTARVQMDQGGERYNNLRRYNEAPVWAIAQMPEPASNIAMEYSSDTQKTTVQWGTAQNEMILEHEPLRVQFVRDGIVQMILNDRSLLHMEHFRPKPEVFPSPEEPEDAKSSLVFQKRAADLATRHGRRSKPSRETIEHWAGFEKEDHGEWEESWSGTKDSKPKGPEGLGLDVSFPGYGTLFGLPEHASPLSLRSTRAPPAGEEEEAGRFTDPYRLMNTDVFEYEYDSPMALYGNAPILHAQSKGSGVSVLWLNAAETWVDLHKTKRRPGPAVPKGRASERSSLDETLVKGGTSDLSSHAHFFSEAGVLDLFVFLGPSAEVNMERFTSLVGRTALPQYFAIGYHQCRWNYLSDDDVKDVSVQFDEADMPMDVIWLDVEYSKTRMYGVWDKRSFIDPLGMVEALDERGRKLVIIIDPHLKTTSEYYLYDEAKKGDLLVKNADGKTDYEGECWPGQSSWIDVFNPKVWEWWISQFLLPKGKLEGNARNLFVWNDMSEPAIFSGPEVTSPKDVIHHGNWENRDLHNINGLIYQNLTSIGLTRRELGTKDKHGLSGVERRPFVLSRAWWLGSQRFGAIWTGDNMGTWEHFAGSVPMILQNGLGGMSFCGADIGGFFGNPDEELLVRWYQAGIFEPFFRAHAHIDTKRREPYLYDGEPRKAMRGLLQLRYQLLPVWYTAFWQSNVAGQPVLKTQHLLFPHDENGFAVGDQFYLGDSGLLVKPPVTQGVDRVEMYLAEDQMYYHYFTQHEYRGAQSGRRVTVPAPLTNEVPLLIRGGSILPVRERNRRAAELQRRDPFTLYIALSRNRQGTRAEGELYMDDGQTFAYRDQNAFIARHFVLAQEKGVHRLRASALTGKDAKIPNSDATALQTAHNPFVQEIQSVRVERIVILGLEQEPRTIVAHAADGRTETLSFTWRAAAKVARSATDSSEMRASELVIRDPRMLIAQDWSVEIQ